GDRGLVRGPCVPSRGGAGWHRGVMVSCPSGPRRDATGVAPGHAQTHAVPARRGHRGGGTLLAWAMPPVVRNPRGGKVNIVYHFRVRGIGAEAVHIAGIAGGWTQLGHEVHFVSPSGVDPLRSPAPPPASARPNATPAWVRLLHGLAD